MKLKQKTITFIVFFAIVIVFSSLLVHEGTHWVQAELSPAVQPEYIAFSTRGGDNTLWLGVFSQFTTTNQTLKDEWKNDSWNRELQAYSLQYVFIGVCVALLIQAVLKKGGAKT
jgi:hypothetical protein